MAFHKQNMAFIQEKMSFNKQNMAFIQEKIANCWLYKNLLILMQTKSETKCEFVWIINSSEMTGQQERRKLFVYTAASSKRFRCVSDGNIRAFRVLADTWFNIWGLAGFWWIWDLFETLYSFVWMCIGEHISYVD